MSTTLGQKGLCYKNFWPNQSGVLPSWVPDLLRSAERTGIGSVGTGRLTFPTKKNPHNR